MHKTKILFVTFILCIVATVFSILFLKSLPATIIFIAGGVISFYLNQPYIKKIFLENEDKNIEKPQVDEALMRAKKNRLRTFMTDNKIDEFQEKYKTIFNEYRHVLTKVYQQLFSTRFAFAKDFFKLPFKFDHALKRMYDAYHNEKLLKDHDFYYNMLLNDIFIFTKNTYINCQEITEDFTKILLTPDNELIDYLINDKINEINLDFPIRKFVDKEDILDIEYILTSYYLSRIIVKVITVLELYKEKISTKTEFVNAIFLAIKEYKTYKHVYTYAVEIYRENYKNLISEEDFKLLIYLLCIDYNAKIIDSGYDLNIIKILYKYDPLFKSYKELNVIEKVVETLEPLKKVTTSTNKYLNITYENLINYCLKSGKITPAMIQKEYNVTYDAGVYLINLLEELEIIAPGDYIYGRELLITSIPDSIKKDEFIIKNHYYNYLYNPNLVIPEAIYNTLVDICSRQEDQGVIYHNQKSIIEKILYNYLPNKNLEDQIIAISTSCYWDTIIAYLLRDYNK